MIAIEELDKQKDQHYKDLKSRDKAIEIERQQKLAMEKLVNEMEHKLVHGGHALEE